MFDGISAALGAVLAKVDAGAVAQVMLGTTHPVNALIRRAALARVGILRIAAPATLSIVSLTSWPTDLAELVNGRCEIVGGGHQFDGSEIAPLDGLLLA